VPRIDQKKETAVALSTAEVMLTAFYIRPFLRKGASAEFTHHFLALVFIIPATLLAAKEMFIAFAMLKCSDECCAAIVADKIMRFYKPLTVRFSKTRSRTIMLSGFFVLRSNAFPQ
jgi:hypothetical protein